MSGPGRLDLSLATPEENLALDEALLLEAEEAAGDPDRHAGEFLRFWESPAHFVVLGVAGKLQEEVDVPACAREGVPILRRASGGGTVLQGPGCLNFSLVLSLEDRPELLDITRSYRTILERTVEALGLPDALPRGTSDIARAGYKFSGNAQKRKRRTLLHHGTILHGLDLERVRRLLREPAARPDYRARRTHLEFVRNIDLPPGEVRSRLAAAWGSDTLPAGWRPPDLSKLIESRYGNPGWTRRF